ncbi:hypothetical protein ACLOJK_007628 [Asimina triloba]
MDALNMLNANFDILNRKLDEMNMNAAGLGDSTYDWWGGDYQSTESQSFVQDFEDEQMTYFNQMPTEQMKQDEAIQQLTSKVDQLALHSEMLENIIAQLSQPELNSNEFCEAITLRNETQMEDRQDNNDQVLEKVADETDAPAENELVDQSEESEKEEPKKESVEPCEPPSFIQNGEKAHQVEILTFPPTIRYTIYGAPPEHQTRCSIAFINGRQPWPPAVSSERTATTSRLQIHLLPSSSTNDGEERRRKRGQRRQHAGEQQPASDARAAPSPLPAVRRSDRPDPRRLQLRQQRSEQLRPFAPADLATARPPHPPPSDASSIAHEHHAHDHHVG